MKKWESFIYESNTYDLSHLDPFEVTYIQSGNDKNPERKYKTSVTFSDHCFTSNAEDNTEPELEYINEESEEKRNFDFRRYDLSKKLPTIIKNLNNEKCFHTNNQSFLILRTYDEGGTEIEYEIYFRVNKTSRKKLYLNIVSAYPRDEVRENNPNKPIGFFLILNNKLQNKPIKKPK